MLSLLGTLKVLLGWGVKALLGFGVKVGIGLKVGVLGAVNGGIADDEAVDADTGTPKSNKGFAGVLLT